jgi:cysteine desulfurase
MTRAAGREDFHGAASAGRPARWPELPVYMDYNATTPVDARVAEAARPLGGLVRQSVQRSRLRRAATPGGGPSARTGRGADRRQATRDVFTGPGSEADQLAIRGAILAGLRTSPGGTPRVITQVTEHPAVLATCEALERWHGAEVTRLPVDADGLVDPEAVAGALARSERDAASPGRRADLWRSCGTPKVLSVQDQCPSSEELPR